MKEKRLFYLGFIIMILGLIWLRTIMVDVNWYVSHVGSTCVTAACLITSLLMAIGGFLMILDYFSD